MTQLQCIIDCNNFYVSCERLFKPWLNDNPVVILSSTNGCIVSCSNSVKALGIKVGTPVFLVNKELKAIKAAQIPANINFYQDISSRIMTSLNTIVENLEVYSIDEAFFTIPDNENSYTTCQEIAGKIEQWVGIPVSIGASYTKTLAKASLQVAKRGQKIQISRSLNEVNRILINTKTEDIWGIGKNTYKKLACMNINSALDILTIDTNFIKKTLGVNFAKTQRELEGIPTIKLKDIHKKKTISSSRIIKRSSSNKNIKFEIARHIGIICKKAIHQDDLIAAIEIKLYTDVTKEAILINRPASAEAHTWLNQIAKHEIPHLQYRRIKVSAKLASNANQNSLYPDCEKKLSKLILTQQKILGEQALFLASGAYKPGLNSVFIPEVSCC